MQRHQDNSPITEGPKLFSVSKFAERHSGWTTQAALRALIFAARSNGLEDAGAIVRLNRRVLLDEARFMGWLYARQRAT